MPQIQTPFLIFLGLLLSSTSLVHPVPYQKQNSQTSSVFSLPLYRRDSFINHLQNKNYTHRAVSRLASDRARVTYINSKLRKALFNPNPDFQLEKVNVQPPDSSLSYIGGEFAVLVGVGNPVREFSLLLDTGSDVTWIKCQACHGCNNHNPLLFNPSDSSSYQRLSCESQKCNDLKNQKQNPCNGNCTYNSKYADNTSSTGEFATETMRLGSSGSVNQVAIGCGQHIKGFKDYAGLLALSSSPIAFPSQINAKSFSYCLAGDGSNSPSTLKFNSAPPGDSVIVPMTTNNPANDVYYYYVELTGIKVGQDLIQIPPNVYMIGSDGTGGIIFDSGTVLTYLDLNVYNSVRDAFRKNIKNQASNGTKGYETCYDVTCASSLDGPRMSFQFHDQSTPPLGPANYLYRVNNQFCLAFQPRTKKDVASIIGNVQQTGMQITYDLQKKLIGFSTNKC